MSYIDSLTKDQERTPRIEEAQQEQPADLPETTLEITTPLKDNTPRATPKGPMKNKNTKQIPLKHRQSTEAKQSPPRKRTRANTRSASPQSTATTRVTSEEDSEEEGDTLLSDEELSLGTPMPLIIDEAEESLQEIENETPATVIDQQTPEAEKDVHTRDPEHSKADQTLKGNQLLSEAETARAQHSDEGEQGLNLSRH
jgi:hypothetical protein